MSHSEPLCLNILKVFMNSKWESWFDDDVKLERCCQFYTVSGFDSPSMSAGLCAWVDWVYSCISHLLCSPKLGPSSLLGAWAYRWTKPRKRKRVWIGSPKWNLIVLLSIPQALWTTSLDLFMKMRTTWMDDHLLGDDFKISYRTLFVSQELVI